MDIYEFALEMEKSGEKLYKSLAEKSKDDRLKTFFSTLAQQETKHYFTILAMKNEDTDIPETAFIDENINVFEQIAGNGVRLDIDAEDIDLYKKAILIEESSRDFNLEKAQ